MIGTEPEILAGVHLQMQAILVVWALLLLLIVRRTVSAGSVGLPAAFVLAMTFLYGGAFVYAMPGYTHLRPDGHWYLRGLAFTEEMVVQATLVTLLGLLGFALGSGAFWRPRPAAPTSIAVPSERRLRQATVVLASFGLAAYAIQALEIDFPLAGALAETGQKVAVAAICAGFLQARHYGRPLIGWILAAGAIAVYHIASFGHASYGFLLGTILGGFWLAQMRRRQSTGGLRSLVTVAVVTYVALTIFVGWFSFRDELRRVVWHGQGSLTEVARNAVAGIELFSPWNFAAMDQINIRLNLNYFIGRMMVQHELFPELRQHGATLVILPLVLVPRFLWPDKPERGGAGFMRENTGIHLSDSATFGTGSVFEFYVNFGHWGVFLGFVMLGWFIRRIDRIAAGHLLAGQYLRFARLFVVGTICIDPLIRPFFMVNGVVFAWIFMSLLVAIYAPRPSRGPDLAPRGPAARRQPSAPSGSQDAPPGNPPSVVGLS